MNLFTKNKVLCPNYSHRYTKVYLYFNGVIWWCLEYVKYVT